MQKNIIIKFFYYSKRDGFLKSLKKIPTWFISRLGIRESDVILKRRIKISKKIDSIFKSTVAYGPFIGLRLPVDSWWGATDRGSMLLGLYEKEVLESLKDIPKKYNTFIDLGAADGYYGIGVLVNNLFEKSICYEISEAGRKTIRENALLNNLLDRVVIRGIAREDFFNEISPEERQKSVLFIDIEGAEFDLMSKVTFEVFSNSVIFIELHEWGMVDGKEKLQKLREDALSTHRITELTMGSRDLSVFPDLKTFEDNDRWLICSEGRGQLMTWLRFDPNT
ncbi:hypothetical protein ICN49_03385 [Polynucleobacter sp. MWH-Mekk-B1]|uniref:hypothetical protein n=1 Tax=Polynucleobacter finlandensis TaxID=1855894 RepID=UPI001C0B21D7|nr:hypothetical protein [Polynucleobacter finlandensis]MBU3543956.1 hypothetical protein [Polynucleobacter finlandensis]